MRGGGGDTTVDAPSSLESGWKKARVRSLLESATCINAVFFGNNCYLTIISLHRHLISGAFHSPNGERSMDDDGCLEQRFDLRIPDHPVRQPVVGWTTVCPGMEYRREPMVCASPSPLNSGSWWSCLNSLVASPWNNTSLSHWCPACPVELPN